MDKKIIILEDDERVIYWDKERRGFYYIVKHSLDYDYPICMFRPGNFDLEDDELNAIYDFIEGRL